MTKDDKTDFSNELYIQIVKAHCTFRLFEELKELLENMKKVKPMTDFIDDTYGLNTLVEATLKVN